MRENLPFKTNRWKSSKVENNLIEIGKNWPKIWIRPLKIIEKLVKKNGLKGEEDWLKITKNLREIGTKLKMSKIAKKLLKEEKLSKINLKYEKSSFEFSKIR